MTIEFTGFSQNRPSTIDHRPSLAVALLAATLLVAAPLLAQDLGSFSPNRPSKTNRVKQAPSKTVVVPAGSKATVELPFEVAQGFHINSNKPNSELLIATVVKLDPPTNVGVGRVEYPAGKDVSFPFAPDEKLSVYTGDFTITALVSPARNTPPGTYRVPGILIYQACDDRACYPPGKAPVAFDVKVARAASRRVRRNPPQSPHVHN